MKKIEEKKEMIQNFEGFYLMRGIILFENPDSSLVNIVANFRFEKPQYISSDLNIIMGKGVQIANKDTISNILSVGVSNLVGNNLFNNSPQLYILKWNSKLEYFQGSITDVDDLTQFAFNYDGNKNINWTVFELNNNENQNKNAGYVSTGQFYKTVPNNPTQEDIDNFLFNSENCFTINLLFIEIQKFLIELNNLYQQGKIIQIIPQNWFSNATNCHEQALILQDNLLKFYVNINPTYFQTYFKQNIDIDNNLKLYN